jgi:hypothetical protein
MTSFSRSLGKAAALAVLAALLGSAGAGAEQGLAELERICASGALAELEETLASVSADATFPSMYT